MTNTEKKKFNWPLFIISFLICFPVAIGYALWFWLRGTRIAKIGGNGLLMIFAIAATLNSIILNIILLSNEGTYLFYFLPANLLSIAMIVFTVLTFKGKNAKLFTILNAVSVLLIFINVVAFGGWLYYLGIMITLPLGLIGAGLSLMGLRKTNAAKAPESEEAPAEEPAEETPAEEPAEEAPTEEPVEEAPAEEPVEEATEEAPAEEGAEEPIEEAAE